MKIDTGPKALQEESAVFLVATGETHGGQETYTRHAGRPPLCDAEKLYSRPQPVRAPLSDADIDRIAESMPGGLDGFMKSWGWRHFARALEEHGMPPREEELLTILAEAYQVVGSLVSGTELFDHPQVQKCLDNLSQQRLVHEDVLPFRLGLPQR